MLVKDISPFVRQTLVLSLNTKDEYEVLNELCTYDSRLFYITDGYGEMVIEDKHCFLKPGCAVLFISGTKYIWKVKNIDFITVNFDYTQNFSHIKKTFHPVHSKLFKKDSVFEKIVFDDENVLNEPIVIENAIFLESRLRLISTEYYLGGALRDELLSSLMKSVIISIVRSKRQNITADKNSRIVNDIICYIQKNYSKSVSNEKIAEIFHFHPVYMNRLFKKHTGVSVHSFLINYRIEMAMYILRTENVSVVDVAYSVGFSDVVHFTKSFKKHTGKTPLSYRNSND